MKHDSMIRDAEVWIRDEQTDGLVLASCLHAHASRLGQSVPHLVPLVAGNGDPLIEQWDMRDEATDGCAASAILGIPITNGGKVTAVLLLGLVCGKHALGAVEIWSRDDRDELGLTGAVFSNLERFATISQFVRFPRGSGLPGQCWEDRETKLIAELGGSPNFMRATDARAGGLTVGVALPIMATEHDMQGVVLFLSSNATPIARRFEIWDRVPDRAEFALKSQSGGDCQSLAKESPYVTYVPQEGLVGKVLGSGLPQVTPDFQRVDPKRAFSARADNVTKAVAMPIHVGRELKSVFVMLS